MSHFPECGISEQTCPDMLLRRRWLSVQAQFGGLTPMGTMLEKKLIIPFVTGPAKSNALRKPVLVIVITDGEPVGESHHLHRLTG